MGRRRVWAVMKSGERWEGDILVGADGIHSKASLRAMHATGTTPLLMSVSRGRFLHFTVQQVSGPT